MHQNTGKDGSAERERPLSVARAFDRVSRHSVARDGWSRFSEHGTLLRTSLRWTRYPLRRASWRLRRPPRRRMLQSQHDSDDRELGQVPHPEIPKPRHPGAHSPEPGTPWRNTKCVLWATGVNTSKPLLRTLSGPASVATAARRSSTNSIGIRPDSDRTDATLASICRVSWKDDVLAVRTDHRWNPGCRRSTRNGATLPSRRPELTAKMEILAELILSIIARLQRWPRDRPRPAGTP
jgi:hypothetical protein